MQVARTLGEAAEFLGGARELARASAAAPGVHLGPPGHARCPGPARRARGPGGGRCGRAQLVDGGAAGLREERVSGRAICSCALHLRRRGGDQGPTVGSRRRRGRPVRRCAGPARPCSGGRGRARAAMYPDDTRAKAAESVIASRGCRRDVAGLGRCPQLLALRALELVPEPGDRLVDSCAARANPCPGRSILSRGDWARVPRRQRPVDPPTRELGRRDEHCHAGRSAPTQSPAISSSVKPASLARRTAPARSAAISFTSASRDATLAWSATNVPRPWCE